MDALSQIVAKLKIRNILARDARSHIALWLATRYVFLLRIMLFPSHPSFVVRFTDWCLWWPTRRTVYNALNPFIKIT